MHLYYNFLKNVPQLLKKVLNIAALSSGINSQTKQNWPSRLIRLNQLLDNDMLLNYLYIVMCTVCDCVIIFSLIFFLTIFKI